MPLDALRLQLHERSRNLEGALLVAAFCEREAEIEQIDVSRERRPQPFEQRERRSCPSGCVLKLERTQGVQLCLPCLASLRPVRVERSSEVGPPRTDVHCLRSCDPRSDSGTIAPRRVVEKRPPQRRSRVPARRHQLRPGARILRCGSPRASDPAPFGRCFEHPLHTRRVHQTSAPGPKFVPGYDAGIRLRGKARERRHT